MNRFTGELGTEYSTLGALQLGVSPYVLNPLSATISDTLTLTQSGTYTHVYQREIDDTLVFADRIDLDVISGVETNNIYRCIDDYLILTDEVFTDNTHVIHITVHDTLDIQQACIIYNIIHHEEIIYRSISQILPLSQSVSERKGDIFNETISQTLSLSQNVSKTLGNVLSRSVNQTLSLTQVVTPQHRVLNYTISDTLTLNQVVTWTTGELLTQSLSDTLTLTQSISRLRVVERVLQQPISFTESINTNKFINIRIAQRLVLLDAAANDNIFYRTIEDVLIFNDNRSLALNAQTILTLPVVDFILIPRNTAPVTYMSGKFSDIYLPQPAYDDSESLNHIVNVNRSMTGVPYTYIKRSKTRTLTYNFSLTRFKAQELGTFYLKNAANPIRLHTFDNKYYVGFITSEPLVYTQNRTNVNDVELTLEVLRLN